MFTFYTKGSVLTCLTKITIECLPFPSANLKKYFLRGNRALHEKSNIRMFAWSYFVVISIFIKTHTTHTTLALKVKMSFFRASVKESEGKKQDASNTSIDYSAEKNKGKVFT